jgi:hypothetical protein
MHRPWLWTVALWSASAIAAAEVDDRAVLNTVLEHFSARRDAHFYDISATLAIHEKTEQMHGSDSDYQYLNQGEGNCAIPQPLYLSFRKRNSAPVPSTQLIGKSPLWRVVTDAEAKIINPAWPPSSGVKRPPVKTLVSLTKPGYSVDGQSAFVNISFLWSIHGAEARYVLRRAGVKWEVTCSQLIFYV